MGKKPGVEACTCNPATLKVEFGNSVGFVPVGGTNPSRGGLIEWPAVIQHKKKHLTSNLATNRKSKAD